MENPLRSDRGATAIVVAVSLLVLLGFTALALDGGMGYNSRRGTQNAADHAALAAAWAACQGTGNPVDAGRASAAANGFNHGVSEVTVDIASPGSGVYTATITTVQEAQFGGTMGIQQFNVVSTATAMCSERLYLDGFAIFAKGGQNACQPTDGSGTDGYEVNTAGGSTTVNGGIHSNGDLQLPGASTNVNGPVTAGGTINNTPGAQAGPSDTSYPKEVATIDVALFRPGGDFKGNGTPNSSESSYRGLNGSINNAQMVSWGNSGGMGSLTVTNSGVYYGRDGIDLTNVTFSPGVTATFVSEGSIHVRGSLGSSGNVAPYTHDLLMFSSYDGPPGDCRDIAVEYSMSGANWSGIIYAPYGQIRQDLSSNVGFQGALLGYAVSIHGSNQTISWRDPFADPPEWIVEVVS